MVDMYMPSESGVTVPVYLYDGIEQFMNPLPAAAYRRHHRHPEQMAESPGIQPVPPGLELVIHVQGHHHSQIHVYQLRGQIQVSLQVGRIHNIHNHIRHFLYEILSHIKLLRAVCGKRICPGQVDKNKLIAPVFEMSFLGINGHPAVVAHMLVASGCYIEKGCLSAVRIADQSHLDYLSPLLRQSFHPPVNILHVIAGRCVRRHVRVRPLFLCLALAYDLYLFGLFPAERYLVSYYFIFYRVFQWGIEYYRHYLSPDKTHLGYSLAETAVAIHLDDHRPLPCLQL